jgi:hypothetical protein
VLVHSQNNCSWEREREREGQITNKIENSNRGGKEEEEDK